MKTTSLSLAILSDVHIGRTSSDIDMLLDALDHWLEEYNVFACDALIITGDLFDKGLSFTQNGMGSLLRWWYSFAERAMSAGMVVRILEGTEYHDRKQGKVLVKALDVPRYKDFDVRWIYDIEVEWIESLGINCLYLRDNHPGTPEEVTKLCEKACLNKVVDMGFLHGNLSYHMPNIPHIPFFDEHRFMAMVKGPIVIGHNHGYSFMHDLIITPGSFNANTHTDTDDKGGLVLTYDKNNHSFEHQRLLNKNQERFITINNATIKSVDKVMKHSGSSTTHLRLYVKTSASKEKLFTYIKQNHPAVRLIIIVEQTESQTETRMIMDSDDLYQFNLEDSIVAFRETLAKTDTSLFDTIIQEFI